MNAIVFGITIISVVLIICLTINNVKKLEAKSDMYHTIRYRVRDLVEKIESNKDIDIDIILANLRDIKSL